MVLHILHRLSFSAPVRRPHSAVGSHTRNGTACPGTNLTHNWSVRIKTELDTVLRPRAPAPTFRSERQKKRLE